jgi:two-component system, chemotaxis family, chemotaxis protein CheY
MGKKILIVDDSATIRQQVSFTLTKEGFDVVEAEDGVQGVAKAGSEIAMIISDVNMPNMNGIEMLAALKAKGVVLPIIMLTTEGSADLIEKAKALGAKGWLVKPFKPEQLVAVVKKLTA